MKTKFLSIIISIVSLVFTYNATSQTVNPPTDSSATFKVFGICDQCKNRIETALKTKGIHSAVWDVDTKLLSVSYDAKKITLDKIHDKITAVGHDTYLKKAKDEVYKKLPKCCLYRDMKDDMAEMSNDKQKQEPPTTEAARPAQPAAMPAFRLIKGVVVEDDKKGSFKPLVGATVMWLETGTGTATDANGVFALPHNGSHLIVSYTGFHADTILITNMDELKVVMATGNRLSEVKVTGSRASRYINTGTAIRTETITQKELFKAACCNLSESFETNPSVDVSYNDAVTGSKQIQLLGLAGIYTQLTVENLPGPRGLATALGLNSIPGPWIESIQLNKGTGSVANGFESIAGQINVELKKPFNSEKFFVNGYVNDFGKSDFNVNLSKKLGSKWGTTLLLHDDFLHNKLDFNKDGFKDLPTGNLFSAMNRWSYDNGKGLMSQFGIKLLNDNKAGGQLDYNPSKDKFTTNSYGLEINTRRVEGFAKIGYVFPEKKYQSIGLQLSAFDHQQESYFGLTRYNGHQQNFYSNLIYQSIINTTANKFRTGLSVVYDKYNEDFDAANYNRKEIVSGGFFEYTYTPNEKFDVVAGLREDYNNLYGWFTTPRLNVRYEPVKGTTIRLSAGRGQRTANIFAENNGVFVSSRTVNILTSSTKAAYGLQPEVAWNKGISIDQKMRIFNRTASLGVDFFRNDFTNQIVVDVEKPGEINFYNLNGKSYSNSLQAEFAVEPVQKLNVRLAYRLFNVKTTYGNQLLQKPLTSLNRAFANLDYDLKGWKFDYTISYNGQKRVPSTAGSPVMYQRETKSPAYFLMNTQVSKTIGKEKHLDIYVGAENLTNYFQKNAIIAAEQPFNKYFDASMVWGPLTARMFYAGFRYKIL
jgi:outer membrane receptor for ferrienterochelin and colicins